MSTNAYYIAVDVQGVWHVSDDELLRPRCDDDMIPTLRVPVIDEDAFRSGYKVCVECDPEAAAPAAVVEEAGVSSLVQTRLCNAEGEAA